MFVVVVNYDLIKMIINHLLLIDYLNMFYKIKKRRESYVLGNIKHVLICDNLARARFCQEY